jgi:hypothetical protein
MKSLQAKVKNLDNQLQDTVKENEKLTEELCSAKLKLEKQTFENNTLQRLLASANKELLQARTKSLVPASANSQVSISVHSRFERLVVGLKMSYGGV